jgi:hypothetical protein
MLMLVLSEHWSMVVWKHQRPPLNIIPVESISNYLGYLSHLRFGARIVLPTFFLVLLSLVKFWSNQQQQKRTKRVVFNNFVVFLKPTQHMGLTLTWNFWARILTQWSEVATCTKVDDYSDRKKSELWLYKFTRCFIEDPEVYNVLSRQAGGCTWMVKEMSKIKEMKQYSII